jgi:hypothetical protein
MICCGSDLVGRMEGGLWTAFVWGVAEFGFFIFCFGVGGVDCVAQDVSLG